MNTTNMTLRLIILSLVLSFSLSAQQMEMLGTVINSEYNELSPRISPDGKTLYFSRISHPSNNYGTKGSEDIWFSELQADGWNIPQRMPYPLNGDEYNSLCSISPDGNTILIAGAYEGGKYETRGFSVSKIVKGGGWSAPQKLNIQGLEKMSVGLYMSGFLSNDGKTLLMSFSEKRDSKIDDLYVSFLEKGNNWSKPQNLGNSINTDATETTPFLASDNYTLYFASDRKDGLGGNDIYASKRLDRSWQRWSKPVNLGEKINTEKNDSHYSIAASGEFAYLVSSKNAIGKGDIARVKLRENAKSSEPILASNTPKTNSAEQTEAEKLLPDPVVLLSGKVIDTKTGKPIEAKIIYETLSDGQEVGIATSNPETGEYKIVLPYGKKYSMRAVAKDFLAIGENIDLTTIAEYKEINNKDLSLVPNEVGASVRLNNIFFEFGKATLRTDSYPELNRVADLMSENRNLVIEIAGHTDNIGSDETNMKLSQERAESVKNYLIKEKVPTIRVSSKGYGETKPIADNNTEEGQQVNRRVEFMIIKK